MFAGRKPGKLQLRSLAQGLTRLILPLKLSRENVPIFQVVAVAMEDDRLVRREGVPPMEV